MQNLENEIILLSQWLKGNHKEDIDIFEPQIFHHRKLFEAIRDGATITQIGAAKDEYGITLAELLGTDGYGAFYYGARGDALKEQQQAYMQKLRAAALYYKDQCEKKNAKIKNLEDSLLSAVTNLGWER